MKIIDRIAIFTICCPLALTLVLSVGCEDSAAARRAEVKANIDSVNRDLWQSTASTTDPADENRTAAERNLKSLLTKLGDTEGASDGQKAEAALLSSSINRKLALMARVQADQIEADQRRRRGLLASLVNVASDLNTVASGIEDISTAQEKAHLASNRQQAQQQLVIYSEEMASADGPINAITKANKRDQSEIDSLREKATVLMRESIELGPSMGFSSYEQAIQVDRNADMIEYSVAHRDLEMEFEHQPRHDLAKNKSDLTQTVIFAIDESSNNVESLEQTFEDEVIATRKKINEIQNAISSQLTELHDARVQSLTEAYEQAEILLSAAARSANEASRSSDREQKSAANIETSAAYQELAAMHWAAAQSWQDHAQLLDRIEAASDALPNVAGINAKQDASNEAHNKAVEAAKEAFKQAKDSLEKVTARGAGASQLETLKLDIQASIDSLSGKRITRSRSTGVTKPGAGTSRGSSTTALGNGADSPEALVEKIKNATGLKGILSIFIDYTFIPVESNEDRMLASGIIDIAHTLIDLDSALYDQFNEGLVEMALTGISEMDENSGAMGGMGGMPMDMPDLDFIDFENIDPQDIRSISFDSVEIISVSGKRGIINITAFGDPSGPIDIRQINGRWYLFNQEMIDAYKQGYKQGFKASGAPSSDDMGAAMMKAMFLQMLKPVKDAARQFTKRVKAGEFASIEAFNTAIEEFGAQMMGNMMGGGMGGPPPGFGGN